jgi:hypothetical protein
MNWKGLTRKLSWPWRDWGKPRNPAVSTPVFLPRLEARTSKIQVWNVIAMAVWTVREVSKVRTPVQDWCGSKMFMEALFLLRGISLVCEVFRNSIYEELHNLYSSPGIIRMMKSKNMWWAGHVARMGAKRNGYRILVGNQEKETTRKSET